MNPLPVWRLNVYPSLPSTSAFCCERAAAGEAEGLATLALSQSAGRGSRGRGWESPPGSLALSVLLRPEMPAAESGQWALIAGVAMAEGLARFLPGPAALTLKWPNDVLLDGKKLGGILVDTQAERGRIEWVVIGFGANLAEAPRLSDDLPVACLAQAGATPSPQEAAAAVLERLGHWYAALQAQGFAAIRAAWMQRGPTPGSPVVLRLAGRQVAGRFAGLADDGSLLLQTPTGLTAYATGEVLFGGAGARPLVG